MLLIKTKLLVACFAVFFLLQSIFLSACSSSFHLRKEVTLAKNYQQIQLENISLESDFAKIFENTLEEAGGQLVNPQINSKKTVYNTANTTSTKVIINNLRVGKRVVAYTRERKARIYLVFLKLEYTIQSKNRQKQPKQNLSLDKTFIYDVNFALGKAEEEKQIRNGLYAEAARLILLYLQYSNKQLLK